MRLMAIAAATTSRPFSVTVRLSSLAIRARVKEEVLVSATMRVEASSSGVFTGECIMLPYSPLETMAATSRLQPPSRR
uniref:Uncharacterized protein n=1 Tax=Arundo donax TaxID=35708 RepID=A0A0A8ZBQ7_ARUDO